MIRTIFAWIFYIAFIMLMTGIIEMAMKKSDFFKSCIYGYDVSIPR